MTIHLPKVNGFGGGNGGGGGSSSLPIIVTSSGSSLPATTGFVANDTFLNTTDKKLYTAFPDGYETNTGVTKSDSGSASTPVSIDKYTGVASGFQSYYYSSSYAYNYISRSSMTNFRWKGEKEYKVHFKITSATSGNFFNILNQVGYASYGYNHDVIAFCLYQNKINIQAYHVYSQMGSGSYTTIKERVALLDTTIEANTEYYLTIKKHDNGVVEASISSTSYTENIIETKTTETGISDVVDYSDNSTSLMYGIGAVFSSSYLQTFMSYYGYNFTNGQIYLLDSTGEFLKENSSVVWNDGVLLEDNTEYLDKTNSSLYLYKNDELSQVSKFANTVIIDTATITLNPIKANTNYIFSNNAITSIVFSSCEQSFDETTIEFSTGDSAPIFSDNTGDISWTESFELQANKSYIIVIFNKIGFIKEY